jgi:hypothetical protein
MPAKCSVSIGQWVTPRRWPRGTSRPLDGSGLC